jgi:hypothetical protein
VYPPEKFAIILVLITLDVDPRVIAPTPFDVNIGGAGSKLVRLFPLPERSLTTRTFAPA